MKTCARCFTTKPYSCFSKGPRYRDGYQSYCRDCMREYRAEKFNTPEKMRAVRDRTRDYYRTHKEARERNRAAGRERDYRLWHHDPAYRKRKNDWKAEQYRNNPDFKQKRDIWSHGRRVKRRNGGKFSVAEWRALCAKYDHRCLCCGEQKRLTPDHVVPISRGGSNAIDNIQPLCLACNMRKHAKTIDYRPG